MQVSIIVSCWNHLQDVTIPFLSEIKKTKDVQYELIMVDNGGEDGTSEYLTKNHKEIKTIRLEKNRGWAGGNNAGYNIAMGDYICFINNDVTIQDPLWLRKMLDSIRYSGEVAVGAREVKDQFLAKHEGKQLRYMDGWCMLVKREFLDKYGVMHVDFEHSERNGLEDVEFSERIRHFGFSWKCIDVGITHLGFRSGYDQVDIFESNDRQVNVFKRVMDRLKLANDPEEYLKGEL